MRSIVLVTALVIGCGAGAPLDGTCVFNGSTWMCTARTPDGGSVVNGGVITSCPGVVESGGACSLTDTTVDTTNPNMPAHYSNGCFACTANGTGTYWSCTSQGWNPGGSFACQP